MARGVSVSAVALGGVGAVAVWAAVQGVGLGSGLRTLLAGHTLPAGEDDLTLTPPGAALVGGATTAAGVGLGVLGRAAGGLFGGGSSAAAAGTAYVGAGHRYRWGGGSPAGWDCSGFCNWVLCHDLGLAIPGYAGGSFTGRSHGPVTGQWALWSGAVNVPRDQVQAGDLVVWPMRHMGIAVDSQQMVHAPGPNGMPAPVLGRISGHLSGPVLYRRLTGHR